jgi:hypothetical protein
MPNAIRNAAPAVRTPAAAARPRAGAAVAGPTVKGDSLALSSRPAAAPATVAQGESRSLGQAIMVGAIGGAVAGALVLGGAGLVIAGAIGLGGVLFAGAVWAALGLGGGALIGGVAGAITKALGG